MSHAAPTAFTGAVLCGGSSRRMGRDKSLVRIDGQPMAVRVADALWAAGASEVIAIGGDPDALRAWDLSVRGDDHPGDGPLAATVTALEAATEPIVMIVACDLLAPSSAAITATLDALAAHSEALGAVPTVGGRRQWTHAAWRRTAAAPLAAAWHSGTRAVHHAASGLALVDVDGLDPSAFADADAPEDLA